MILHQLNQFINNKEFQNTQCLFIAEVKVLMGVQKENRLSESDMGESSLSE